MPISRGTFTVDLPSQPGEWITLPGQPILSVTDVLVDGELVPEQDWRLVGGRLWRRGGWQRRREPSVITVTVTGGLDPVPEDIVDLVCAMVGSALARVAEGYASRADDPTNVRIDDYSETRTVAAEERLAGPMELPQRTRDRLRARFGGGATVVGVGR